MKRPLFWIAVGVVLVANGWVSMTAWQQRRNNAGGTLKLTERELSLVPMPGESTVTLLNFEWDASSDQPQPEMLPEWLDDRKLVELGFDGSVPLNHPLAGRYYRSISARSVFLVLEYQGDAWRETAARRRTTTRLFVLDAGRDPGPLRERYSDRGRYVLVRGLVKPVFLERERPDGPPLEVPRLRGRVLSLLPAAIFVPWPHSQPLRPFLHDELEREDPAREPRYAVTVSWGVHHEPWVTMVELLVP